MLPNLARLSFDIMLCAVSEVTVENAAKIPSVYHITVGREIFSRPAFVLV
jgi:hypothetical protein